MKEKLPIDLIQQGFICNIYIYSFDLNELNINFPSLQNERARKVAHTFHNILIMIVLIPILVLVLKK